jgi:hypothetical protein
MTEWHFAQTDPAEELALLHHFSMKKSQPGGEVEFLITVREYVNRNAQFMRFFAKADKQVNQKTAPVTPCGWGETLLEALSECMKAIHRFPYEGDGA